MDQFLEQSAPYFIAVGLVGMLVVVGLLIYVLARLARAAAMIEESVLQQRRAVELQVRGIELAEESVALQRESSRLSLDQQRRGIELAEESVALHREANRLLKECLDRPRGEQ
jgi:hypothetical protein